ncbi:hypothetical protein HPB52_024712 [Rhipicephalus sanguineus]|uniref:Endonuclease/exonuclease/phosphatase domain-containing protein n=1 Tax=Rhipicephalus sanguineus TaxID=34632 RepID=A0A9D4YRS5_RHISA|nr:hypothetical protein HPB52_024712 [Rhipicephalus sanguineus]
MPASAPPPPPDPGKHRARRHLALLITADRSVVAVWQCNCRGFLPKRNHLLLHLHQLDPSATPDIIVLQESHADVSLSRFVAYNQAAHHPLPHPVKAVLTRRTLVVTRADLPFPEVHHVFLEILPQHCEQPSLFLLNVYNPPRATENAALTATSSRRCNAQPTSSRPTCTPPISLTRRPNRLCFSRDLPTGVAISFLHPTSRFTRTPLPSQSFPIPTCSG